MSLSFLPARQSLAVDSVAIPTPSWGQALAASWQRRPGVWLGALALTALLVVDPVWAQAEGGLPKMPLPGTTQDQNDLLNILWGWGRFLLKLLLILGGAAVFLGAASVGVKKYMDINSRDGSLGELVPVVGVGLLIMIVTGILLTAGWTIISTTNITP